MAVDAASRNAAAWAALARVPDPEVPALSLVDLGIVREVQAEASGTHVVLTPTYSGCPATEVIRASVHDVSAAGVSPHLAHDAQVHHRQCRHVGVRHPGERGPGGGVSAGRIGCHH